MTARGYLAVVSSLVFLAVVSAGCASSNCPPCDQSHAPALKTKGNAGDQTLPPPRARSDGHYDFGLQAPVPGLNETNGQVFISVFSNFCERFVQCGAPKPYGMCLRDAMESTCKEVHCDAVFVEDRSMMNNCARALREMSCDRVLKGEFPSSCPQ